MSEVLLNATLFVGALVLMEGVAYLSHRFLMHGPLWCLHRSHHEPRHGTFERNDAFAVFFSVPSMVLIYIGTNVHPAALWTGLGVAAYGVCYLLFHDVLVHRRIAHGYRPSGAYLRRIVHAHRLHHASRSRRGAVSFGFLVAPQVSQLRAEMRRLESAGYRFDAYESSGSSAGVHKPETSAA